MSAAFEIQIFQLRLYRNFIISWAETENNNCWARTISWNKEIHKLMRNISMYKKCKNKENNFKWKWFVCDFIFLGKRKDRSTDQQNYGYPRRVYTRSTWQSIFNIIFEFKCVLFFQSPDLLSLNYDESETQFA